MAWVRVEPADPQPLQLWNATGGQRPGPCRHAAAAVPGPPARLAHDRQRARAACVAQLRPPAVDRPATIVIDGEQAYLLPDQQDESIHTYEVESDRNSGWVLGMRRLLKLTQLMLFSPPCARSPHARRGRPGLRARRVQGQRRRRPQGLVHPRRRRRAQAGGRVRARLDVEPARQRRRAASPLDDRDVDFLPVDQGAARRGLTACCCTTSASTARARAASGLLSFGPLEKCDFIGAVNYLRAARRRGRRTDRLARHLDGRQIALYGAPECQPIKSILAVPAVAKSRRSTPTSRGPVRPVRARDRVADRADLPARRRRRRRAPSTRARRPSTSTGRSSTTRRARATAGARWSTSVAFAEGTPTLTGRSCTSPRPAATTATATCRRDARTSSTSSADALTL